MARWQIQKTADFWSLLFMCSALVRVTLTVQQPICLNIPETLMQHCKVWHEVKCSSSQLLRTWCAWATAFEAGLIVINRAAICMWHTVPLLSFPLRSRWGQVSSLCVYVWMCRWMPVQHDRICMYFNQQSQHLPISQLCFYQCISFCQVIIQV